MRIPTDQAITFIAATGQLSGLLKLLGADSKIPLLDEPQCERSYTVKPGESCDSIAPHHNAPTYQIICQNDHINGKCTNLGIGETICLGRRGEDCTETFTTADPFTNAPSIAKRFGIPLDIFEANNYCYQYKGSVVCPRFNPETTVCIAKNRIGALPKCDKIFV